MPTSSKASMPLKNTINLPVEERMAAAPLHVRKLAHRMAEKMRHGDVTQLLETRDKAAIQEVANDFTITGLKITKRAVNLALDYLALTRMLSSGNVGQGTLVL